MVSLTFPLMASLTFLSKKSLEKIVREEHSAGKPGPAAICAYVRQACGPY